MLCLRFGGSNGLPRDDYRGFRLINLCGDDPVARPVPLPTWDCRSAIRTRRWFCRGVRAFVLETRRLAHRGRRHLQRSVPLAASRRHPRRAHSGAFVKITPDMFQWPVRTTALMSVRASANPARTTCSCTGTRVGKSLRFTTSIWSRHSDALKNHIDSRGHQ